MRYNKPPLIIKCAFSWQFGWSSEPMLNSASVMHVFIRLFYFTHIFEASCPRCNVCLCILSQYVLCFVFVTAICW